jgi:transketolase
MTPQLISHDEINRIRDAARDRPTLELELLAEICRANVLTAIKLAGSGHIGSSLSALDIVVVLHYRIMNTIALGHGNPDRDVFISSKGHDVPGLYSVLHSAGVIPDDMLRRLRRHGGLDGHPDVSTFGIEANSGSLGMGVSKGKGIAWAKSHLRRGGQVYVLTGDGELQEGQNFEAFQSAAHHGVGNLNVIVDHNKIQSDKAVDEIIDLGRLEDKLVAFGWRVARCDGHDFEALVDVLRKLRRDTSRPKILIADTIKGRGVSFMEHPRSLRESNGVYAWHSGAPDDSTYASAWGEVIDRLNRRLAKAGVAPVFPTVESSRPAGYRPGDEPLAIGEPASGSSLGPSRGSGSGETIASAFGAELLAIAERRHDVVVLDGDLAADCQVRPFERLFPERFIENGIAEQDMVSTAGGLARHGLLPVVNSFASFLVSRANEQIYNNATEGSKIIYACHFAGLTPAAPGKSHQSVRDISLLGAIPNLIIVQPCTPDQSRAVLRFCIDEIVESCAIRLTIGPAPGPIDHPDGDQVRFGCGTRLSEGSDALLFAYGPTMVYQALQAAMLLANRGFALGVIDLPWLNRVDDSWLDWIVSDTRLVAVVEDHSTVGGLGDHLLRKLSATDWLRTGRFEVLGVDSYPVFGTPAEVLSVHRLDARSLAERIEALV